jgi:Mechanosensitive ion channel, conserved TM helix
MWDQIHALLLQSSNRIFTGIANFLPGLLALLLILFFTVAVIAIFRLTLRRFLRGVEFDERVARWGFSDLAQWSPKRSPALLLIRFISWTIFVVGLLAGISALDAALPSMLVVRLLNYIPNVLAALIVLAVGIFAARFLGRSVLISAVNMKLQSARLLSLGVKWLVLVLAGAMALEHLGIGGRIVTLSFGILFGGIVLALALAVGLGSKDVVSRSWEQQSQVEKETEEHVHHL